MGEATHGAEGVLTNGFTSRLRQFLQLLALESGEPVPGTGDKLETVGDPDISELLKKRDRHHPAEQPLPDASLPFAGAFTFIERCFDSYSDRPDPLTVLRKTIPLLRTLPMRETSMQGMPSE